MVIMDEEMTEEEYMEKYGEDLTEYMAAQQAKNESELLSEIVEDIKTEIEILPEVIAYREAGVLDRIKMLGNKAVYVLEDLLLDDQVSDKVRLDAIKAVIAIVEREANKDIVVVEQQSADLEELERLIREGGFNIGE
jgi:hypothetical protein